MTYRFFSDQLFTERGLIVLEKEEMHHLTKVMRVREGATIEVVNGKGQLAIAIVSQKTIVQKVFTHLPPPYKSVLIQAIPEPAKLDLIVEKGCELGVTDFWLFPSEKGKIDTLSPTRQDRLQNLLQAALKQSKRLFLPTIALFPSIKALPQALDSVAIADPRGAPFTPFTPSNRGIVIGPESGLTEKEVQFLEIHLKATRISLSPNILRVETAAIIAAYIIAK